MTNFYKEDAVAKPELKLVGEDGNAFAILGKAARVARTAGWSQEEIRNSRRRPPAGIMTTCFLCVRSILMFFKEDKHEWLSS